MQTETSAIDRTAPSCGYDVGRKRQYRREVYRALCDGLVNKPSLQVLLMPSIEGDEIDVALSHGFAPTNLHVVDKSKDIIETLTRQRRLGFQPYGCDLFAAFEQIRSKGLQLDVANIDWTAKANDKVLSGLRGASRDRTWSPRARVAVSFQRGREDQKSSILVKGMALPYFNSALEPLSASHCGFELTLHDSARLFSLFLALMGAEAGGPAAYFPNLLRSGSYRISKVSILWSVWEVVTPSLANGCWPGRGLFQYQIDACRAAFGFA